MNLRTLAGIAALVIVIVFLPNTAGELIRAFASGFGQFMHALFPHH